jgi:hypothetical protein
MNSRNIAGKLRLRRTALTLGLAVGLGASGMAFAQSNATGTIFGQATPGATVLVSNPATGFAREIPVDSNGRYRVTALPVGSYTVTLQQDGQAVSTRENVGVRVGGGTEASFASGADAQELGAIQVVASALPSIDVSSVDTRTVLTAEQLSKVPVARNITAAALLAPGTVHGDSRYGNLASFGGSAVSENAYYINGYAVTNPLTNLGYTTLPFDAIEQMQTITGGYGAEFGRATGGVVNIVTKRGTNQWKAGAAFYWTPEGLSSAPRSIYYPNTGAGYPTDGQLYQYRTPNKSWQSTMGAYVSGALIKDKLFLYATGEFTRQEGKTVQTLSVASTTGTTESIYQTPRWLAKIDWNITDNHIVEFTGVSDKTGQDVDYFGPFSYTTFEGSTEKTGGYRYKDGGELYIGKYTGYITDDLTITALYGKQKQIHYAVPQGYEPTQVNVADGSGQGRLPNAQPYRDLDWPDAYDKTKGWRLDIEYRLDSHTLRAGYDAMDSTSMAGTGQSGPGYSWIYNICDNPGAAIPATGGAICPTSEQYAYKYIYANGGTFTVKQEAQYIEDRWQIGDRWLASIGLRNEQFTNYNSDDVPYVRQRHQLAPRLGISWDVNGDSTFKLFANAGRYHLAMPNNVALRGAAGSTYTTEYFSFDHWDPVTGVPVGAAPIGNGPYSANKEFGQAPDPRTVAAKGLKSHYQDEYILGMEKALSANYNFGAKATYRELQSAIDDTCDPRAAIRWAEANGIDPFVDGSIADSLNGCRLFNPGEGNTFELEDGNGGFITVPLTAAELGFPKLKRKYLALDMFIEHPFDGVWYGKVGYTWSRNYGNAEGQLDSDIGQGDVSQTVTWDHVELMEYASGDLPNDRPHVIKAYGFWQVTPEWQVGGNFLAQSGRPSQCLGYYPTDFGYDDPRAIQDDPNEPGYNPTGFQDMAYGPYYHFCNGVASPRGDYGRLPWTYQLDVNAAWRPAFADHKLEFKIDVFNVLNSQTEQSVTEIRELGDRGVPYSQAGRVISFQSPRYVRFGMRYDFSL